jgi:hypothetical protein
MDNDKLNNETDDLFRKGLENLSEKDAGEAEWLRLKSRMKKEGLLTSKMKGRRFLLLLLLSLSVGVALTESIYFLYNENTTVKEDVLKTDNTEMLKSEAHSNQPHETKNASTVSGSTGINNETGQKTIAEINRQDNTNALTNHSASNERSEPALISKNKGKVVKEQKATTTAPVAAPQPLSQSPDTAQPETNAGGQDGQNGEGTKKAADSTGSSIKEMPAQPNSPELTNNPEPPDSTNGINNPTIPQQAAADTGEAANTAIPKDTAAANDSSKTMNDTVPVAQKKKTIMRDRFHIGGFFSLDFNDYYLKKNNVVPVDQTNYVYNSAGINGINSFAQFTAGITAAYMITDHIEVEGDAAYSKKREVSANVSTPAVSDSFQTTYSQYIYNYNATYLEFGGKVKYYFSLGNRKWLYAGAGGIAGFNFPANNLGSYEHIQYQDSVWVKSDKVILQPSSALFTALLLAGFETAINDRWSVFVEPEYKYGFSPVIEHPTFNYIPVNHYLRSFSIGFGIKYGFK